MTSLNSTDLTSWTDDEFSQTALSKSSLPHMVEMEEYELNRVALICVYTPFIAIAVAGNLLVIVAYCRYEKVRAVPTNALIFSLSISDFLVGSMVLTINLVWVFRGYWMFGEIFCRLWSALDYSVTYMSTVTMVLISVDRFLLTTKGANYKVTWTRKRAIGVSIFCWVFTIIFYLVIAFSMRGSDLVDFQEECELEIVYVVPFTIGVLIWEFGIPLPLLLCLNAWVYYKIYQRSTRLKQFEADLGGSLNSNRSTGPFQESHSRTTYHVDYSLPSVSKVHAKQPSAFAPTEVSPQEDPMGASSSKLPPTVPTVPTVSSTCSHLRVVNHGPAPSANSDRRTALRQRRQQFTRHRKAGVTLFILSGTYLVCWLPYEIVSLLQAMCGKDHCFSETTWEAVNGLLWCNSALNPFLYGLTNPLLRHHVWYILRSLWCRRSNRIAVVQLRR